MTEQQIVEAIIQMVFGKKKLCCDFEEVIEPEMKGVLNALHERESLVSVGQASPLSDSQIETITEHCVNAADQIKLIRGIVEIVREESIESDEDEPIEIKR